jgi:hypothetical protein
MILAHAQPKTGHPNCRRPDKVIDAGHRYEALAKWPNHTGNWGVIPGQSGFVGFDIDIKSGKQGESHLLHFKSDMVGPMIQW